MTQFLIVISANVMPLDFRTNARRVRTWPMKVTNTVTKEISIVFANIAHTKDAVDGRMPPLEEICGPHRGCTRATTNQRQLSDVE